jgi:6-phospho-beta-glucosidase
MKKVNVVALLGGGSVWTPHLLEQLTGLAQASDLQIRLQGPTESNLREVAAFARRITGENLDIKVTADLREAVQGADLILNQARIGGWSSRLDDEIRPVQLGMVGDESLGLGGLRAAARTWPFIAEASKIILHYAPDAWILNLTNPSDLVSRAWREAGCPRVASLCDLPQTLMLDIATLAEKPEAAHRFGFLGMSHVGWLISPPDVKLDNISRCRPHLMPWAKEWKAIPTPWRVHLSDPESLFLTQQKSPGRRARMLKELAEQMREVIRNQDVEQYHVLLAKRFPAWYSMVVAPAIRGLLGGESARLIVGMPNKGKLPHLDHDVHVEGWAIVNADGIHPEPYPESAHCQEDITHFGQSRALAFAVMTNPDPYSVARYIRSDALIQFASSHLSWEDLVVFVKSGLDHSHNHL